MYSESSMPAAFTFNCPTEVEDAAANYAEFQKAGAEVYIVTTDTHFSHKVWHETSPAVGKAKFPLVGDPTHTLTKAFDVFIPEEGLALRGTFVINPDGGGPISMSEQRATLEQRLQERIRELTFELPVDQAMIAQEIIRVAGRSESPLAEQRFHFLRQSAVHIHRSNEPVQGFPGFDFIFSRAQPIRLCAVDLVQHQSHRLSGLPHPGLVVFKNAVRRHHIFVVLARMFQILLAGARSLDRMRVSNKISVLQHFD